MTLPHKINPCLVLSSMLLNETPPQTKCLGCYHSSLPTSPCLSFNPSISIQAKLTLDIHAMPKVYLISCLL